MYPQFPPWMHPEQKPQGENGSSTTRLGFLAGKFPPELGQTLDVTPAPGGASGTVVLAKDLVRWQGDPTDITPFRLYLAPWSPRSDITPNVLANTNYAAPTPWQPDQQIVLDSFVQLVVYARITWGAGGVRHIAYIDWPRRGLLFQVSGSYVQLDGVSGGDFVAGGLTSRNYPILGATLGLEPGGGDASAPATYSYQPVPVVAGGSTGIDFQVPPFGRSFIPLLDVPALVATGATAIRIRQKRDPSAVGGNESVVDLPLATFDPAWVTNPMPILDGRVGLVRVEPVGGAGPFPNIGMQFHLDL